MSACAAKKLLRHVLGLASLLGLLGLSACGGPKTNEVSGKVLYKGQPLPRGDISFFSPDGKRVGTSPIFEGNYDVKDAPVGMDSVTVSGGSPGNESMGAPPRMGQGKKVIPMKMGERSKPLVVEAKKPGEQFRVPAKYGDPKESGLSFEVIHGSPQTHDINIE